MISLNDYLYDGHTVLRILKLYAEDLRKEALRTGNEVDLLHSEFLDQFTDLLEHNDFLTAQSQKLREFYKYMAGKYPTLAFTFKGRIKSLIRAEAKFNGNIVEFIYDYYTRHGKFPTVDELKAKINFFRDLIAYRIVISIPKCRVADEKRRHEMELEYLYEIANRLPEFMHERGFSVEPSGTTGSYAALMEEQVRPFYRDYIVNANTEGYQSLHITFYDNASRCFVEVQLRTKEMDDYAEIGPANHWGYEKKQQAERARRDSIPKGECQYFDDAYERCQLLQDLELAKLDVNMFGAINNSLINDGCGLHRGRLILPYEHLSRFQNDQID